MPSCPQCGSASLHYYPDNDVECTFCSWYGKVKDAKEVRDTSWIGSRQDEYKLTERFEYLESQDTLMADTIKGQMTRYLDRTCHNRMIHATEAAKILGVTRHYAGQLVRTGKLSGEKRPEVIGGVTRWVIWIDGREVVKYSKLTRSQRYMYGRGKVDLDGNVVKVFS